jgi:hypothetical protein
VPKPCDRIAESLDRALDVFQVPLGFNRGISRQAGRSHGHLASSPDFGAACIRRQSEYQERIGKIQVIAPKGATTGGSWKLRGSCLSVSDLMVNVTGNRLSPAIFLSHSTGTAPHDA